MRVHVDEPRRHDQAGRIDGVGSTNPGLGGIANKDDAIAGDSDIGFHGFAPRAVEHRTAGNEQIGGGVARGAGGERQGKYGESLGKHSQGARGGARAGVVTGAIHRRNIRGGARWLPAGLPVGGTGGVGSAGNDLGTRVAAGQVSFRNTSGRTPRPPSK